MNNWIPFENPINMKKNIEGMAQNVFQILNNINIIIG